MRNRPAFHSAATFVPPASSALAPPPPAAPVRPTDAEILSAHRRIADLPQDGSELTIARTSKAADGIDVYIAGPPIAASAVGLQVRVYAIVGELRALVDAVFVHRLDSFTAPQYVAAARCSAEAFEVTVSTNLGLGVLGALGDDRFTVTAFAARRMAPAPEDVGVFRLVFNPILPGAPLGTVLDTAVVAGLDGGAGVVALRDLRLIGLEAVNTAAAARFLLIYDQFGPAGAPIAANLRQSIHLAAGEARRIDFPRSLRDRYRNGLQFEESTSPTAFVGGGSDIIFTAWVK